MEQPGAFSSLLTTLHRKGDKLEQLGQAGDMGRGERIYRRASTAPPCTSSPSAKPTRSDTFYLTNPAAPKVVGELKITGYSGYLHPIGDNLVIGVGQEATTQGRTQGAEGVALRRVGSRQPQRVGQVDEQRLGADRCRMGSPRVHVVGTDQAAGAAAHELRQRHGVHGGAVACTSTVTASWSRAASRTPSNAQPTSARAIATSTVAGTRGMG